MDSTVRVLTVSVFYAEVYNMIWDIRWLLLLSLVLILSDLWYGVGKSRKRGLEIRISRAIRRTLIKIGDYLCIIILGSVLGKAIGEPLGVSVSTVAVCCMLVACYAELESVVSNLCECKGYNVHFSLWGLVKSLVGLKNKALEEVIENTFKEEKENEKK